MRGWEKAMGTETWHFFDKGVSLCKHWMGGAWGTMDHDLDDKDNCPECVKFVRAGNTTLDNPFGKGKSK